MQFDTTLTQFSKNETNEIVFKNEYLSVQQKYVNHYEIFTDGSKQDKNILALTGIPVTADPFSTQHRACNSAKLQHHQLFNHIDSND